MNSFQQIFLMKSKEYHLLLKVWKNIITFHRFLKKSYCTFNRLLMESYLSPKWAKIGAQNLVWQIGSWQYGPTLHLKNWYAPGPFLRTPYLFWEYLFCFILISCRCLANQNFFFFFCFCNEPIWLAHCKIKIKIWNYGGSPNIEDSMERWSVSPPFAHIYIYIYIYI